MDEYNHKNWLAENGTGIKYYTGKKALGWSDWNIINKKAPPTPILQKYPVNIKKEVIHRGWEYGYCPFERYYVNGEWGTKDYLYQKYGIGEYQYSRIRKQGGSMEDACNSEPIRYPYCIVNGVKVKVREMWEMFGLNPKRCNNLKSSNDYSYEQVLLYQGVDPTGYIIKAVTAGKG